MQRYNFSTKLQQNRTKICEFITIINQKGRICYIFPSNLDGQTIISEEKSSGKTTVGIVVKTDAMSEMSEVGQPSPHPSRELDGLVDQHV